MKKLVLFSAALALFACHSNSESADGASGATWESKISYDEEIHLEGIRQLVDLRVFFQLIIPFQASLRTVRLGLRTLLRNMRGPGRREILSSHRTPHAPGALGSFFLHCPFKQA